MDREPLEVIVIDSSDSEDNKDDTMMEAELITTESNQQ